MVSASLFSQPYQCIEPPTLQSPPKTQSTSVNYHLAISPLLFHKIILTILFNTPFLYTSATFHLPIFAHNYPSNLHQNIFPYPRYLADLGSIKRPRSLRNNLVLISPFFPKVWTVTAGFLFTDSLSLRLRKFVYCKSLMNMFATGMANHPIHLLLHPQPIVSTSIPY